MHITLLPDRRTIDVPGGTTVAELHTLAGLPATPAPICARVNNKYEDLSFTLYAPKQVEYLAPSTPEGARCYVRSLCMMLYRAVAALYPGATLRVRNSISHGYYCT
ncbi:MAG: nucleoside kinase, partial [Duncaniella sp.]|nr:nucleoside kinase [Duncaniella sp.]